VGSDNDRRVLLAIALIMVVYYVWVAFISPPPPVPVDDASVVATQSVDGTEPAPTSADVEASAQAPDQASVVTPADSTAVLAQPVVVEPVPTRAIDFSSSTWQGVISSSSGGLGDLTLRDFTTSPTTHALYSWVFAKIKGKSEGPWHAYSGGRDPLRLLSEDGSLGVAGVGPIQGDAGYLIDQQGDDLVATRHFASGLRISKRYRVGDEPHKMLVEITFDNTDGPAADSVWVGVVDRMSGSSGRFSNASRPLGVIDGKTKHLKKLDDVEGTEDKRYDGPVSWIGVGDRYFMAALAPDQPITGTVVFDTLPDGRTGSFLVDPTPLDAGASRTYTFNAFIGPKDLDLLQSMGHDLDKAVEFGFFGFFSRILLFLLKIGQKGVHNWGLAIIALTVLVKAAFFPLTQKAFVSSKKMQALQPKMKALQEKYKDNKELQSTETMKLFKENGVNPMGGCLPTFIQLPVWFALYGVMLNSVELYDTSFLYLKDLTAADPYGVLPVLYAGLILFQQQMMPMGSMDPAQQRMMKMLPLVFAFMMFTFPSGLVLYFCCNIGLTVFQQWLINRTFASGAQQLPAAS